MKRWAADTLGTRLFLLMWAALVVSHVLAFAAVRGLIFGEPLAPPDKPSFEGERWPPPPGDRRPPPPDDRGGPGARGQPSLPTFPSLPPTPGIPMVSPGAPSLPWTLLVLDYGVRLLIIAGAAWFGSRWLARPMKRLVQASAALVPALARGTPTRLDEREGTREVRDAAAVFNGMAAQIAQQFEARGLMIAAISHDLRTPLTRIRMRLETSDVGAELRDRCVADIREMNALIDTVLDVFRGAESSAANAHRIDVAALIQALVDDRVELGASVSFDADAAVMRVDPVALRRLVGNLIDNALRYAGAAEVSVRLGIGDCRVRVEDRGPGIPNEQLVAVLQPFYRVEGSRNRETGGSGLGLFIAKELAERQGGRLELHNRHGGGLSAVVVLPTGA